MKKVLFAAILGLTVYAKANESNLQCEALYGYKLQLTLDSHILKSALIKLSDSTLLNSQVATQPENEELSQSVNTWNFPIPSEKRIFTLMLPQNLYQDSEIPGTLLIEAPTISAEFPIACKIID